MMNSDSSGTLLDQLAAAHNELADLNARWESYSGNNPDKYVVPRQRVRERVAELERACKDAGLLPLTQHEALEQRLNQAFSKPQNKAIVEFEGKFYQRRFSPATVSREGNPTSYVGRWEALEDIDRQVLRLKEPVEFNAYRAALSGLWPFARTAGGIEFDVAVGAPALTVTRSRRAVGYTKGQPNMRLKLEVTLTTVFDDWEKLAQAAQPGAEAGHVRTHNSLRVAGIGASKGWAIEKTGRSADSLELVAVG